jgi:hypothetical protein
MRSRPHPRFRMPIDRAEPRAAGMVEKAFCDGDDRPPGSSDRLARAGSTSEYREFALVLGGVDDHRTVRAANEVPGSIRSS